MPSKNAPYLTKKTLDKKKKTNPNLKPDKSEASFDKGGFKRTAGTALTRRISYPKSGMVGRFPGPKGR